MKRLFVCLSLVLFSCGKKEATFPDSNVPNLHDQIARMSPKLQYCDGMPAGLRSNNIDKRPNCDVGDGMSETGRVLLDGGMNPLLWNAQKQSIDASGRPWRAVSYVGRSTENSFSRDQLMGLIEGTVASGDKAPLRSVLAYAAANKNKLCPDARESRPVAYDRCFVTSSMWVSARDALGDPVSALERAQDEGIVNTEAATVPVDGYEAYLVARKIMLRMRTGKLTASYAHAAQVLHKRAPQNLFIRTVYLMSHKGSKADFDEVGTALAQCMAKWEGLGDRWLWSEGNVVCTTGLRGHEMVALGRFISRLPFTAEGLFLLK